MTTTQFELIENFRGNEKKVNYIIKDFTFSDYKASIDRNYDLDEKGILIKDYSVKDKRTYYTKLIKYCENIIKNKYQNKVIYTKNICGRYFSNDMSLQYLPNEIRGFLCDKIMTDIDIKNSMPTIIRWYCKKHNIITPYLDMYVNNRETILYENKDLDKMTFIKSLNSSKCKHTVKNDFFNEFDRETKIIQKKLMELENDEIQNIIKSISEEDKKNNLGGMFLCRLYFTLESDIILYLKNTLLKQQNINVSSYNFDGLEVDSYLYEKPSIISFFNDELKKKYGFDDTFSLVCKENTTIIQMPDGWDGNKIIEDEDSAFNRMSVEFEENHCKIINNNIYIKEFDDKNILFSKKEINDAYCHITCGFNKKTNKPASFITKWLNLNDNIRCKDNMEAYPNDKLCPDNCYNLWRPWRILKTPSRVYSKEDINNFVECLKDNEDDENEEVVKISQELQKILNLIFILCNNDAEVYKYFILWLAQMFKYPEVKSKMIIFISKEGAGKGTLLRLIENMMGKSKVLQIDNPKEQIFGAFNGIMKDSFFCCFNECGLEDMKKDTGRLKQLITDSKILINEKGIERFEMNSFHRFFFTTNMDNPVIITKDNRRNVVIRSSDELIGNTEFFDEINDIINNDIFVKEFYDYLINLNDDEVKGFNKLPIPKTEHSENLKELSLPIPEQFVKWLIYENCEFDTDDNIISYKDFEIGSEGLYEKFEEFKNIKKIRFDCNVIGLTVKIKNLYIDGIGKRPTKKCNYTTFNTEQILKHFKIDF